MEVPSWVHPDLRRLKERKNLVDLSTPFLLRPQHNIGSQAQISLNAANTSKAADELQTNPFAKNTVVSRDVISDVGKELPERDTTVSDDNAIVNQTEDILAMYKTKRTAGQNTYQELQQQLDNLKKLEATLNLQIATHVESEANLDKFTEELQTQLLVRKASTSISTPSDRVENVFESGRRRIGRLPIIGGKRQRDGDVHSERRAGEGACKTLGDTHRICSRILSDNKTAICDLQLSTSANADFYPDDFHSSRWITSTQTPILFGRSNQEMLTGLLTSSKIQQRFILLEEELSKTCRSLNALEETVSEALGVTAPSSLGVLGSPVEPSVLGHGPLSPTESTLSDKQFPTLISNVPAVGASSFTVFDSTSVRNFIQTYCPQLKVSVELSDKIPSEKHYVAIIPVIAALTTPACLFSHFGVTEQADSTQSHQGDDYCNNAACPYLHACQAAFVAKVTESIVTSISTSFTRHNKKHSDIEKNNFAAPSGLQILQQVSEYIGKQHAALSVAAVDMELALVRLVESARIAIFSTGPTRREGVDVAVDDQEFFREVETAADQWLEWLTAFKCAVATDAYIWQAEVVCTIVSKGYHLLLVDQHLHGPEGQQKPILRKQGGRLNPATTSHPLQPNIHCDFESSLKSLPFSVTSSTLPFHKAFVNQWRLLVTDDATTVTRSTVTKLCMKELSEVANLWLEASATLKNKQRDTNLNDDSELQMKIGLLHQREEVAWRALILVTRTFPAHELIALSAMLKNESSLIGPTNATNEKIRLVLHNETMLFQTAINRCPSSPSLYLERCCWMWKHAKSSAEKSDTSQCDEVVVETLSVFAAISGSLAARSLSFDLDEIAIDSFKNDLQLYARLGTFIAIRHMLYCASKCLSGGIKVTTFVQKMNEMFLSANNVDIAKQESPIAASDALFAPPPPPPTPISKLAFLGPWGLHNLSLLFIHLTTYLSCFYACEESSRNLDNTDGQIRVAATAASAKKILCSFVSDCGTNDDAAGSVQMLPLMSSADAPIERLLISHQNALVVLITNTVSALSAVQASSAAGVFGRYISQVVSLVRAQLLPTFICSASNSTTRLHPDPSSLSILATETSLALTQLFCDATEGSLTLAFQEVATSAATSGAKTSPDELFSHSLSFVGSSTTNVKNSRYVWQWLLCLSDTLETVFPRLSPSSAGLGTVQLFELYNTNQPSSRYSKSRRSVQLAQQLLSRLGSRDAALSIRSAEHRLALGDTTIKPIVEIMMDEVKGLVNWLQDYLSVESQCAPPPRGSTTTPTTTTPNKNSASLVDKIQFVLQNAKGSNSNNSDILKAIACILSEHRIGNTPTLKGFDLGIEDISGSRSQQRQCITAQLISLLCEPQVSLLLFGMEVSQLEQQIRGFVS